jgi:hypothetical protein
VQLTNRRGTILAMKKLVALVLVVALALVVGVSCRFGHEDDPFTAKYRLIREGMTHEEAVQLLGPADDEEHCLAAYHSYCWKNPDDGREVWVTWDWRYRRLEKALVEDETVILSESARPWWQRLLTSVGLR